MNFLELPENVIFEIVLKLNLPSIYNLLLTNSAFNKLFSIKENEYFWKYWAKIHLNKDIENMDELKKYIDKLNYIRKDSAFLKRHNLSYYLIKQNDLELLKYDSNNLNKIINNKGVLSEEIQLAAVKIEGYNSLQTIIHDGKIIPSEKVQKEAIKQNPLSIQILVNNNIVPTKKIQKAAVKRDINTFGFINNPDIEIQLIAIKQSDQAIRIILGKGINPHYDVIKAAIEKDISCILYFENLDESLQLFAIEKNIDSIMFINNPTEKVINYIKTILELTF
jgi:hypothetical protein